MKIDPAHKTATGTWEVKISAYEPPPGWADKQTAKLADELELLYGARVEVQMVKVEGYITTAVAFPIPYTNGDIEQ